MGNNGLQIYLAGAMTGLTHSEMTKWRDEIKTCLEKCSDMANYKTKVVSPVDYFSFENDIHQSDLEVMNFDLSLVRGSDIVVVNTSKLNNSVGTIVELYEAWKSHIPVIAYDENGDYKSLHPWLKCFITRVQSCISDIGSYIKELYMR